MIFFQMIEAKNTADIQKQNTSFCNTIKSELTLGTFLMYAGGANFQKWALRWASAIPPSTTRSKT